MIYWRWLRRARILEHLIPIRNDPFKLIRVHKLAHCARRRAPLHYLRKLLAPTIPAPTPKKSSPTTQQSQTHTRNPYVLGQRGPARQGRPPGAPPLPISALGACKKKVKGRQILPKRSNPSKI